MLRKAKEERVSKEEKPVVSTVIKSQTLCVGGQGPEISVGDDHLRQTEAWAPVKATTLAAGFFPKETRHQTPGEHELWPEDKNKMQTQSDASEPRAESFPLRLKETREKRVHTVPRTNKKQRGLVF